MKLKRIKCFLTGGHRYSDSNLQVIHDTTGYHFVNHCVKCGKVCAAFMSEGTMQRQIEKDRAMFGKGCPNEPFV